MPSKGDPFLELVLWVAAILGFLSGAIKEYFRRD